MDRDATYRQGSKPIATRHVGLTHFVVLTWLLAPLVASAGVVQGTIRDKEGNPVEDAYVMLMDNDPWGNPDDHMGSDFTDAEGKYRIPFSHSRRWDGADPEPDPYIIVRVSKWGKPAAAFDPYALVWKSQTISGMHRTSTRTIDLGTRPYCGNAAFGCSGPCPGGCSGVVFLWLGSCYPCTDLGTIPLEGRLTPYERLLAQSCAAEDAADPRHP